MRKIWLILLLCLVLFWPSFATFWHQDDFIDLSLSQNASQVVNAFNIFTPHPDFPFYRPIPTQLYFFVARGLFGLAPLGYHVVNFLIFGVLVVAVYKLILAIAQSQKVATIATILYAVNSTHFAALTDAAYAHELIFALFAVLTLLFFLQKKSLLSLVFFILALMSKESAVMLPAILFLLNPRQIIRFVPYPVVLAIYLVGHFLFYGLPQSSSYQLILGKQNFNILGWYFLWSFSVPNILIDYLGSGLKILPTFWGAARENGPIFLGSFFAFVAVTAPAALRFFNNRLVFQGTAWFILGLLPVLIFPLHKLAIEQTFPMVGLLLAIAVILSKSPKILTVVAVGIYLVVAVNSIYLARRTHWIARGARQAQIVVAYFQRNYPNLAPDAVIYFKNGQIRSQAYGSSWQIALSLAGDRGLKIMLGRPNLQIYYEDLGQQPPAKTNPLIIDSSQFWVE